MNHTPAPWIYDQKRTRVVAEDRELLVADIRGWGNLQKRSDGAEIMDANGYLIAAAPELLAALQAMVTKYGEFYGDTPEVAAQYHSPLIKSVLSVIAKAQGVTTQ